MSRNVDRTIRWLLALTTVACAQEVTAPPEQTAPNQVVFDGLRTQLSVHPTAIAPGEELTATYSIENTHSEPVRLKSACAAIARGVVYREGQEAMFIGSGSGCYNAIGIHDIPAGDTLVRRWQVQAAVVLRAYPDGREPDIAPAERGDYVFRVEPDVFGINAVGARLPSLEQRIEVR